MFKVQCIIKLNGTYRIQIHQRHFKNLINLNFCPASGDRKWRLLPAADTCADPEGGGGGRGSPPPPLKNRKNIGFLSNSGPDSLKNHEATKPETNIGPSAARQRNAI